MNAAAVLWFRRDLRLADHPALRTAADEARALGRPLVALFVVEDGLLAAGGPNRRAHLAHTLAALDASVDGRLVLRRGRPGTVVPGVAAEVGATTVHASGDWAPYGRRRDDRVAAALSSAGRTLVRTGSPYAVSPGRLLAHGGGPYRVFTPYRRAWAAHGWAPPTTPPSGVTWARLPSDVAPSDVAPDPVAVRAALPDAGEEAAAALLDAFVGGPLAAYGTERDRPDHDGTSRLSPHLHLGTLHPRQILARLPTGPSSDAFRSELAWREFYADVLWHRPDSAWASLSPIGNHLRCDAGPEADRRFAAWASGRTGFPLVDAGMRQLVAEGWMHNRVRMLTASFLVKDLHLPWQRGAAHFLDLLVDGDLASNNHGWQWVAGTGTDAAPFHRVFNPGRQAERFDPDGAYVRRYVPEFGTPDYPEPVVDHAVERLEALARWQEAREAAALAATR